MYSVNPITYLQFLGNGESSYYSYYRVTVSKKNIQKLKDFLSNQNPEGKITKQESWVYTPKEKQDEPGKIQLEEYVHIIITHRNYSEDLADLMKFLSEHQ